jgi:radical SAM-linked protein
MPKVAIKLSRGDEVKYISHLDMMRSFEFALRRGEIPISYSEGFNPRPKMSFGSAVGVGVTSDDERIVLDLSSYMPADELRDRLNAVLPSGIRVNDAVPVQEGVKSPIASLNASRFQVSVQLAEGYDRATLEQGVDKVMDSPELKVTRVSEKKGTRVVDIRPNLISAAVLSCEGETAVIEIAVKLGDASGARPQDFMQALGNHVSNINVTRIHRSEQFHSAE